ncbi:MAG: hypothetical protein QM601_03735 [Pseudoxanthomonas sp.]
MPRVFIAVCGSRGAGVGTAALGLAVWLGVAAAQTATHPCASVVEPARRLACYDQAFPPPPQTRAEMAGKARAEFGLDAASDPLHNPLPAAEAAPQDIQAVLVRLDYRGNSRTFVLDNGQVWVQTDGAGSGHVKVGEQVRIRKALLGSYLLVMPSGVAVRVKRSR